ncbi:MULTISPECIES: hypothetical protein [unclassified Oleiphilus]|uniref:hypothetical protein n=1 Tax=unclassified Oleiphilus TaxID=2631174 RepID=UPI0007C334C7|nr:MULTISPECIES: hypothetical protein [unclassified Oleiphilus]KZZ35330.1 hypothetical protein A3757_15935 [Oleiphilus sp. HI0117]KZZ61752.1 hypothetical protein A3761_04005 [Oleiphilus sp. HI0123]
MKIQHLIERYDLKPQHTYLLELVPLIEVMWADGRNQSKEVSIIHEITEKHVAQLNSLVEGVTVVSKEDTREFLNRFLHVRPSEGLLSEIRELTIDWLKETGKAQDKGDSILSYCIDIAAACASTDKFDDRVVEQEKLLLKELTKALNILN